jgi:hypothetical protein
LSSGGEAKDPCIKPATLFGLSLRSRVGKICGSPQGILIGGCFASCLLMALSISPVRASGQAGSNGGNAAASKPAAPATGASQTTSASPASTGSTAATTAKSGAPTAQDIAAAKASAKVSVNTETGVYHTGGRWYGKTKKGKFMTEAEAKAAGYKGAKRD